MRGARSTPWRGRLIVVRGEAEGTGGRRREAGVSATEATSEEAPGEEEETFWKNRRVRDGASFEARRCAAGGFATGKGGSGKGGGGESGATLR